jgi:ParB family chromosome partitioning protein
MSKKKELGKGLRALISNIEETQNSKERASLVKTLNEQYALIRLEAIEVNPFQPRNEFVEEELMDLAKSIKVHGLIQPLTVRSLGGNSFQLISGERRMRASKMAGLQEVPAYIRIANDQEMLELALIENIQRADLNALEVAISYQRLMDECDLTHEQLSDRIGKNRSTITNYVRLLKLPPEIQQSIKDNDITMGHARAIAGISNIVQQMDAFKKTISNQWSVRNLEKYLKQEKSTKDTVVRSISSETENIQLEKIKKEISATIGTPVLIKRTREGQGQIIIKFKNDKEFNAIYDILKDI